MTKIVAFRKPDVAAREAEALRVVEQAYAYFDMPDDISAESAIRAVETPIEQMFAYHPAA